MPDSHLMSCLIEEHRPFLPLRSRVSFALQTHDNYVKRVNQRSTESRRFSPGTPLGMTGCVGISRELTYQRACSNKCATEAKYTIINSPWSSSGIAYCLPQIFLARCNFSLFQPTLIFPRPR
jgi:hypothetical protein